MGCRSQGRGCLVVDSDCPEIEAEDASSWTLITLKSRPRRRILVTVAPITLPFLLVISRCCCFFFSPSVVLGWWLTWYVQSLEGKKKRGTKSITRWFWHEILTNSIISRPLSVPIQSCGFPFSTLSSEKYSRYSVWLRQTSTFPVLFTTDYIYI